MNTIKETSEAKITIGRPCGCHRNRGVCNGNWVSCDTTTIGKQADTPPFVLPETYTDERTIKNLAMWFRNNNVQLQIGTEDAIDVLLAIADRILQKDKLIRSLQPEHYDR